MERRAILRTASLVALPSLVVALSLISYSAAAIAALAIAPIVATFMLRTGDHLRMRKIGKRAASQQMGSPSLHVDLSPTVARYSPSVRARRMPAPAVARPRSRQFIVGVGLGLAGGIMLSVVLLRDAGSIRDDALHHLEPRYPSRITFTPVQYGVTLQRIPRKGFSITERMLMGTNHDSDTLRFVNRIVHSTSLGLLRKKVTVDLRCNAYVDQEIVQNPSILSFSHGPVGANCPDSVNVELAEMPVDMFYQARDAGSVMRTPFVDTESVRWTLMHPDKTITFAYLAPPAHVLRPFIPEGVWSHAGGRLLIIVLLFLGSVVVFPILVGVGAELVKAALQKRGVL